MNFIIRTWIRLLIWLLESELNEAENIQNRLRYDIPHMRDEHKRLLTKLWAIE